MRVQSSPRVLTTFLVLAIGAGALGACTTPDGVSLPAEGPDVTSSPPPAGSEAVGNAAAGTPTAAAFAKSGYCPPLEIRAGTEAMTVYERGHEDERDHIRYQASISRTARECSQAGSTLSIKVGVSGRVLAGPKGGAGTVTLPVRVAVVKQIGGTKPVYSNLFKISVSLTPPALSTGYSQVFDVLTEVGPQDRDLLVFVGFDQGK